MSKIPKMSFDEMLSYTTNNNDNAKITVGIIQNGEVSYAVYGKDGTTLPDTEHTYEIGSITKTFTTALLYKAVDEGKIDLNDNIDKYLELPAKSYYPTLRRIVSHSAGYKGYYFEGQMVSNFFKGKNDFYGISQNNLINRIGKINLKNKDYSYKYSNFGMAVIGAVLAKVYQKDYTQLVNDYVKNELQLDNTMISTRNGDLGNYWDWTENDAYLAAGGLTSTITDMLEYAQMQLNENSSYLSNMHNTIANINATSKRNAKMSIRSDAIGAAWYIDTQNNIIWHNGGTDNYNSYIGFDKNKQIAVVVLSNLKPSYRIPATVMGVNLLTDLQKGIE